MVIEIYGFDIDSEQIDLTPDITANNLYIEIKQAMLNLIYFSSQKFLEGKITQKPQPKDSGTFHHAAELRELKKLDLDRTMTVGKVIDILRACTFPPYPSARFMVDDVEYDIKVQIEKINK